MNEVSGEIQRALVWIIGILMAVLGFFVKRQIDRQDQLESRACTREELQKCISDMRDERAVMHEENRDSLDRIHERVDKIWERITR